MFGRRAHKGAQLKHLRIAKVQPIEANPVVGWQPAGDPLNGKPFQRGKIGRRPGKLFDLGGNLGERILRHSNQLK